MPSSFDALTNIRSKLAEQFLDYLQQVKEQTERSDMFEGTKYNLHKFRQPLRVLPFKQNEFIKKEPTAQFNSTDSDHIKKVSFENFDMRGQSKFLFEVALNKQKLLIIGDPGAGKTEFLKEITRFTAVAGIETLINRNSSIEEIKIPVYLTLNSVIDELKSTVYQDEIRIILTSDRNLKVRFDQNLDSHLFAEAIIRSLRNLYNISQILLIKIWNTLLSSEERIEHLKTNNIKSIICLDGWDEVSDKKLVKEVLERFVATSPAQVILTSRTLSVYHLLPNLRNPGSNTWQICQLDFDEVKNLIRKFFKENGQAQQLINEIEINPVLANMIRNPLIASLACQEFDNTQSFSTTKGNLYEKILMNYLLYKKPEIKGFAVLDQLAEIIEKLFPLKEFSLEDLEKNLIYTKSQTSGNNFFNGIDELTKTGVFVQIGKNRFRLLHSTFGDYLTARSIANKLNFTPYYPNSPDELKSVEQFNQSKEIIKAETLAKINKKSWSDEWKNVIILVAGQLQNPLVLLELLVDYQQDDAFRHRLCLAARCLNEIQAFSVITKSFYTSPTDSVEEKLLQIIRRISNGVLGLIDDHYQTMSFDYLFTMIGKLDSRIFYRQIAECLADFKSSSTLKREFAYIDLLKICTVSDSSISSNFEIISILLRTLENTADEYESFDNKSLVGKIKNLSHSEFSLKILARMENLGDIYPEVIPNLIKLIKEGPRLILQSLAVETALKHFRTLKKEESSVKSLVDWSHRVLQMEFSEEELGYNFQLNYLKGRVIELMGGLQEHCAETDSIKQLLIYSKSEFVDFRIVSIEALGKMGHPIASNCEIIHQLLENQVTEEYAIPNDIFFQSLKSLYESYPKVINEQILPTLANDIKSTDETFQLKAVKQILCFRDVIRDQNSVVNTVKSFLKSNTFSINNRFELLNYIKNVDEVILFREDLAIPLFDLASDDKITSSEYNIDLLVMFALMQSKMNIELLNNVNLSMLLERLKQAIDPEEIWGISWILLLTGKPTLRTKVEDFIVKRYFDSSNQEMKFNWLALLSESKQLSIEDKRFINELKKLLDSSKEVHFRGASAVILGNIEYDILKIEGMGKSLVRRALFDTNEKVSESATLALIKMGKGRDLSHIINPLMWHSYLVETHYVPFGVTLFQMNNFIARMIKKRIDPTNSLNSFKVINEYMKQGYRFFPKLVPRKYSWFLPEDMKKKTVYDVKNLTEF